MTDHRTLLDAFAEARATWDEMVSLQPDIKAGSRQLTETELVELERRVEAHRIAVDALADAVDGEPPDDISLERGNDRQSESTRQSERDDTGERRFTQRRTTG